MLTTRWLRHDYLYLDHFAMCWAIQAVVLLMCPIKSRRYFFFSRRPLFHSLHITHNTQTTQHPPIEHQLVHLVGSPRLNYSRALNTTSTKNPRCREHTQILHNNQSPYINLATTTSTSRARHHQHQAVSTRWIPSQQESSCSPTPMEKLCSDQSPQAQTSPSTAETSPNSPSWTNSARPLPCSRPSMHRSSSS
jgi:hypothetical protein